MAATERKQWVVHPDDPDMVERVFRSLWDAQTWAAALCCSYWIEEVEA